MATLLREHAIHIIVVQGISASLTTKLGRDPDTHNPQFHKEQEVTWTGCANILNQAIEAPTALEAQALLVRRLRALADEIEKTPMP